MASARVFVIIALGFWVLEDNHMSLGFMASTLGQTDNGDLTRQGITQWVNC